MTTSAQKFDRECTGARRTDRELCTRGLSASEGRVQWSEALDSTFCEMDVAWPRKDSGFTGDLVVGDVDDMSLSRVRADPHRVTRSPSMAGADARDDFILIVALAGEITLSQHRQRATLTEGAFSILDTAAPFVVEGETDFEQIVLNAPRELLSSRLPEDALRTALATPHSGRSGLSGMVSRLLVDLSETSHSLSDGARASTAGAVLDLVATSIGEQATAHNPTMLGHQRDLLRVQQELVRSLHVPGRGITEISSELGMSVRYIHKLFEHTQQTPRGFLTDERMKRARWLLLDTDRTVAEISARVGYRDVAHFSRAFSTHFGLSPTRYRASGRVPRRRAG